MGMQELRTLAGGLAVGPRRHVRLTVWDLLAALQSTEPLRSSFVLWQSPAEASHRSSASPLAPYLCRLQRNTLIEPAFCFAITDYGMLVETSVSNSYAVRDPFLQSFLRSYPSPARYTRARLLRGHRLDLEAVILLATIWPHNYFHFYRDFLPKILMLEEANVDNEVPVIVPDGLFDQLFFREAIQSERLSRWKFISPRGQFIRTKDVLFCSGNQFIVMDRSAAPEPELLVNAAIGTKLLECPAEILALLGLDEGQPPTRTDRRIFLSRSETRGRTISNYEEIEPLLHERGFEPVDTDGMSLRQQADLFRGCRYLVGIHGAGLTNIVHAYGRDLSLLQLRQPGEEHLVTDFALMCHSFGFEHQEIFGSPHRGSRDAPFHVDVALLQAGLDRMLG